MCGIFGIFNNDDIISEEFIIKQFNEAQHRGPDNSQITTENNNFIGFHRLSINGVDDASNQPFIINNKLLICNGEIYNYKQLYDNIPNKPTTNSDCEIIIYLYELYGIEYTLNILDGVFAFILIDYDINKMYVARDPYGVRPLFYLQNENAQTSTRIDNHFTQLIGFASEVKQLCGFTKEFGTTTVTDLTVTDLTVSDLTVAVNDSSEKLVINPIIPGQYMTLNKNDSSNWVITSKTTYTNYNLNRIGPPMDQINLDGILTNIHDLFCTAVIKRVQATDRPIACLLSGGLDSSIVTSLVSKYYPHQLETYSIGLKGSEDLAFARKVATHLNTQHTEIIVEEVDFFNFIPHVIKTVESYDTTTIRASVGNYLVAKYISENSEAKVIFNGDGSDEVMGGYLYMPHAPEHFEFDKECKRLLKDIHIYDVLRSDRSISTNGLEPRTPFLDREFTNYYLSIPSNIRYESNKTQEKYLFRKAFDKDYLPKEVLWRKKEAFSDGVSSQERSWHTIIEENITKQTDIVYDINAIYKHNPPQSLEQLYYRTIFEQHYPNEAHLIPYFWMPKYIEANDCSARTLEIYSNK
jgi:asparagine synthase (glutamine-hydrolysing)